MSEAIIVAIITGGLALVGVIITNITGSQRMQHQLETTTAVLSEKVDNIKEQVDGLRTEVAKHNNFAGRVPVLEENLKDSNRRIKDIEDQMKAKYGVNYKY